MSQQMTSVRPTMSKSDSKDEPDGASYEDLYELARQRNLKGRSKMSKTELARALGH